MGRLAALPDANSPLGAVLYGVVAAALLATAAAAWSNRSSIVYLLTRAVQPAPKPLRALLRVIAYNVYPGWVEVVTNVRTRDGEHGLNSRLLHLKSVRRPKILLVGGIYVDVILSPIGVQYMDESEYADLDRVRLVPGGSARWVGHYLWQLFEHRSYLFTRIGREGSFSKELSRCIRREEWIRRRKITTDDGPSAVSVVLVQQDQSFHTTFTYQGVLLGFGWNRILRRIQRTTGNGGILYISGYFRTNLCEDLRRALRAISPRTITCVDHGRFRPGDNSKAVKALQNAFTEGLIDIYLCSFPELCRLMEAAGHEFDDQDRAGSLARIAQTRLLPKVTVVRGSGKGAAPAADVIIDNEVTRIELPARPGVRTDGSPGRASSFNAGFLYGLTGQSPRAVADLLEGSEGARSNTPRTVEPELSDAISHAVRLALSVWARNQ